jgi:hypothetical protein
MPSPKPSANLLTLGQIRHATIKMNTYYPLIARAVERLERSSGEARQAVYERAREAVAQLRSNQPALLDAEITKERLALEEAIRKVEAEAARKSPTQIRAEPRSAAPPEGMPDGDDIQSRDQGQPASPDRDDRPPALLSRQAPTFMATASDDRHNTDVQAAAIGGAYGADQHRCPTARLGAGACTGFLGAARDCGGRAGCAYARSYPADAYRSTCPTARLGLNRPPSFYFRQE